MGGRDRMAGGRISRGVTSANKRRANSLLPLVGSGLGRGASRDPDFSGSTGGCIVRSRPAGRSGGKGRFRKLERRALSMGASVGGGGKIRLGVDEGRDIGKP